VALFRLEIFELVPGGESLIRNRVPTRSEISGKQDSGAINHAFFGIGRFVFFLLLRSLFSLHTFKGCPAGFLSRVNKLS
jgi:hypothetical protein